MLRVLRQSRLDNSRDAEMIALTSIDMLIVDDFTLEPMTKEESRDVYQLFLERTGRGSMIGTSITAFQARVVQEGNRSNTT
jgi:DNA replication protein DnaC